MNSEATVKYLVSWLQEKVSQAGANGIVLGVSGGVDSAVAAIIAQQAFPDSCLALVMPCESHITDRLDSELLLEKFNIAWETINLENVYQALLIDFESYIKLDGKKGDLLKSNIKPRLRMLTLYYWAQAKNYLVLGTSNKSELSIGYATKYGDHGVDLQLLGDLLKHEIYQLAKYLDVPQPILDKPPSAGLWAGQTDENEMGISYEELDHYLATKEGTPQAAARIEQLMAQNAHKKVLPPIAIIPK